MSLCEGRYATSCAASVADGWSLDRRTPASRLFGANGLRTGPDGCIYIAQVTGSQISALDLGTGQLEISPDGALYFPVIGANEIWRIDLEGGEPQRVALDLGVPSAVKFDSAGYIVSTQVHSGQVPRIDPRTGVRIDPRTGDRTVLASLNPGLDNLTFVGDRVFVSNGNGEITEILAGGETRTILPGGLTWPLDLAMGDDGNLYIADGNSFYVLLPDRMLRTVGMLFTPGYPGFLRGLAAAGASEFVVTTAGGQVSRYRPGSGETEVLADGFDPLYGVAVGAGGAVLVAELGTGRVLAIQSTHVEVLASGLSDPVGVAIAPDGTLLVSESGAGRVVKVTASGVETLVDGLQRPQGTVIHDGQLHIVDAGAKTLIAFGLNSGMFRITASGLPVGAPPGPGG